MLFSNTILQGAKLQANGGIKMDIHLFMFISGTQILCVHSVKYAIFAR